MKGFGQYVRRPLGFFVTLYATLITLFGLAWVLFLIGWIYVGEQQVYAIHIIDSVLVALFAIMGDGLAPFRAVDTYHMIFIARYVRIIAKAKKKAAKEAATQSGPSPNGQGPIATGAEKRDPRRVLDNGPISNDDEDDDDENNNQNNQNNHNDQNDQNDHIIPSPTVNHSDSNSTGTHNDNNEQVENENDANRVSRANSAHSAHSAHSVHSTNDVDLEEDAKSITSSCSPEADYLTSKQRKSLAHHQKKLAKSHSFYKPHETFTHHAFPLGHLIAIIVLLDCHSCLQISLGATTWGIDYHHRPFAITTVILCVSIACNLSAGLVIMYGDRKTRKKDVVDLLNRQALTGAAIKKVKKKRNREQETENEGGILMEESRANHS